MDKKKSCKQLEDYFKNDTFAACNHIKIILVDDSCAICKVEITENSLNAERIIQGGLIYTLADFAFAVFANYISPVTFTQTGNISYIKAGSKDNKYIYATVKLLEKTNRNIYCNVTVTDEKEEILAIANFNGFSKKG